MPDAMPFAQPCHRQSRHPVGNLTKHESAAHRDAVHRAAGRAGDEQSDQEAARPGAEPHHEGR